MQEKEKNELEKYESKMSRKERQAIVERCLLSFMT